MQDKMQTHYAPIVYEDTPPMQIKDERGGTLTVQPLDGAREGDGWHPMATAPKDEGYIDLWCVLDDDGFDGQDGHREPDVMWNDGGWARYRDDGMLHRLEERGPIYPRYKATHWRRPPGPPSDSPELDALLIARSQAVDRGATQAELDVLDARIAELDRP